LTNFSAYNERTKAYKNAKFDFVFDTDVSQSQVYQETGVNTMIKQVVDVRVLTYKI